MATPSGPSLFLSRPGVGLFFSWPIVLLASTTLQFFSAAVEISREQITRDHLLVIRLLRQLKAWVPTPGARRATGLVRPWSVSAAVGFVFTSLLCPVSVSLATTAGLESSTHMRESQSAALS
jgi:hypothetical protein